MLILDVLCRCKYSEFGCERKELLSVLVPHEEICSQRTVNCPQPNGCNEPVQMVKFFQHALQHGCSVQMKAERTKFNLSKGWMQWDGLSLRKGGGQCRGRDFLITYIFLPQERNSTSEKIQPGHSSTHRNLAKTSTYQFNITPWSNSSSST